MKLIFISGPSGSGKTTLSNQIIKKNKNGIVLSTDNYYKTGLISKLLPKFIEGFFDRSISFNKKLFKKDFDFIYKNGISICDRYYNFEKKTIKNILKKAEKNVETIMPGFTHLKNAQPVSFAHYLMAYLEMFNRDKKRFRNNLESLNENPLGVAALTGTSFKIDRFYTSKKLGFTDQLKTQLILFLIEIL